jgi:hypothetical protein
LEEERASSRGNRSRRSFDGGGEGGQHSNRAFMRKVWRAAKQADQQALMRGETPRWEPLMPLVDPRGLPYCPGSTMRGVKCAVRLLAWINGDGITEFRRRDALRAVDGTFSLSDGAEEALGILSRHGAIRECAPLGGGTPGRKSGTWWIVNPSVSDGL